MCATLPAVASTGSFRRRRLGRELRRLRDERSLRLDDVAPEVDIAPATLSRIELAQVEIKPNTVRALVSHYEVDAEQAEALVNLAREARQQVWWHAYGDVLPDWFEVYVDLETESDMLSVYDAQVVNGLLQTEDYARAIFSPAVSNRDEVERRVELRMERQKRVSSGELRLHCVMDECVLHRSYGGPAVMAAQIERLIDLAQLSNVSLQVLPAGAMVGVFGVFTVLEFPEPADPRVVYLEHDGGALYLEKAEQTRQYARLYDSLRAAALSPEASVAHLAQLKE